MKIAVVDDFQKDRDQLALDVEEYLKGLHHFEEILITRAGGVISSHCGPGTLGVLFYEKG